MVVVARTRQRDHILGEWGTLMARCIEVGLPVASACSGKGACGKCLMTILRGAGVLDPPSPREAAVLTKNAAGADQRLGCQCWMPAAGADLLITTGYW
ncbi:MAG: 2Fe-2S iron-sulfur cluster-binding protein [Geothrix sp.]|nr:2Fe-2S iron-sulfur cluster-binding protein [Geothrix sp.]